MPMAARTASTVSRATGVTRWAFSRRNSSTAAALFAGSLYRAMMGSLNLEQCSAAAFLRFP